jgi:hypothetical protein
MNFGLNLPVIGKIIKMTQVDICFLRNFESQRSKSDQFCSHLFFRSSSDGVFKRFCQFLNSRTATNPYFSIRSPSDSKDLSNHSRSPQF